LPLRAAWPGLRNLARELLRRAGYCHFGTPPPKDFLLLRYAHSTDRTDPKIDLTFNEETMADVRAEMTANVWQVPAVVGQVVAEGDVLVILESMKMEIPVEAPKAGTVTEVRVKPEDTVQENDILVVIS
jgi:acetyl-CoA carboxylase biotin carboxyl carrier protein